MQGGKKWTDIKTYLEGLTKRGQKVRGWEGRTFEMVDDWMTGIRDQSKNDQWN